MKKILLTVLCLALSSCVGIRKSGDNYTAHAEAFNLLGLRIPADDYKAAMKQVPEGATIHSVHSTPSDWTSVYGGIMRIIGFTYTEVSGKLSKSSSGS